MKDLKKFDIAIEVIERCISIQENTDFQDTVFQLRNGKNYLETMKPYLYGTSELIGMNKEYIEED